MPRTSSSRKQQRPASCIHRFTAWLALGMLLAHTATPVAAKSGKSTAAAAAAARKQHKQAEYTWLSNHSVRRLAQSSHGDQSRLMDALQRYRDGKNLTIVTIGGSVTAGQGAHEAVGQRAGEHCTRWQARIAHAWRRTSTRPPVHMHLSSPPSIFVHGSVGVKVRMWARPVMVHTHVAMHVPCPVNPLRIPFHARDWDRHTMGECMHVMHSYAAYHPASLTPPPCWGRHNDLSMMIMGLMVIMPGRGCPDRAACLSYMDEPHPTEGPAGRGRAQRRRARDDLAVHVDVPQPARAQGRRHRLCRVRLQRRGHSQAQLQQQRRCRGRGACSPGRLPVGCGVAGGMHAPAGGRWGPPRRWW